jgi:LacI family transcriptional regulator
MFASGLQAFQEVLSEAGVTLLIGTSGYRPDEEFRQIKSLIGHGVGGLLLIGRDRSDAATQFLRTRQVPYVLSWCLGDEGTDTFAGFDNQKAAAQMLHTVLDHGHRDIGLIVGKTEGNDRARARLAGMTSAIDAFGRGAKAVRVIETEYRLEYGAEACEAILSSAPETTAIVCGNDVLAAGALTYAKKVGLNLPDALSIVGFDDIGIASVTSPALTTVRVPQIEMGCAAAELILERISGVQNVANVTLDTKVIMRDSLTRRHG